MATAIAPGRLGRRYPVRTLPAPKQALWTVVPEMFGVFNYPAGPRQGQCGAPKGAIKAVCSARHTKAANLTADELARAYIAKIERQQCPEAIGPIALIRDVNERVPHFLAGTRLRTGRYEPLFSATPSLAKCFHDPLLAGRWAAFFCGLHMVPAPKEAYARVETEDPPRLSA
jgi:hypothetical protein